MRYAQLLAICTSLCLAAPAFSQQPTPKRTAAPPPQQAAKTAPQIPDPVSMIVLIRTTLIALNQANQTGNYSVLREISAPPFQSANTQAQLAVAFTSLRDQQLDIGPIAAVTPELTETPSIDQNNVLRLVGFFPTEPLRVNFQLTYLTVGGTWKPVGLAVGTSPNEPKRAPVADAQRKQQPQPPRAKP